MHTRFAVIAALVVSIAAPAAKGAALDDMRRSLPEFRGVSPMKVRIDMVEKRVEKKKKTETSGTFVAEDDGTFIRLVYPKSELRRRLEERNGGGDGAGTRALELMNYAPVLLKSLEGATLKKATQTSLDGAPALLLEIVPVREKNETLERFVKSFTDVLLVWLNAGGVPVAAERTQNIKAGILMLRFEAKHQEKYRFAQAGDHLVVTRHTTNMSASGLGQDESGTRVSTVSIIQ